jgi:hypothetical protein
MLHALASAGGKLAPDPSSLPLYPVIRDAPLDLGSEHGPFPLIRIPMQYLDGERAFLPRPLLPMTTPTLTLCDSDGDVSDLFWSSWPIYLLLDLCCFKIGKDCRSRYGTVRCLIRAATSDPVLFQSLSSSISRGFLSIEYSSHRTWRKLASSPSLHSLVAPPQERRDIQKRLVLRSSIIHGSAPQSSVACCCTPASSLLATLHYYYYCLLPQRYTPQHDRALRSTGRRCQPARTLFPENPCRKLERSA